MPLNWIHIEDFSFQCLALMERFQIDLLCGIEDDAFRAQFAIALRANPVVSWCMKARCPQRAPLLAQLEESARGDADAHAIRAAETHVMARIEDFVVYMHPTLMDSHCDFIYAWDKRRLFELADFQSKRVLDVGSGSGRLAFAAAEAAFEVYAAEPVGMLRDYLNDRIAREGIRNVRVASCMVTSIPYPDSTFDIVMSGHVVGDDTENELRELARVVKPGGWLLDCPGETRRKSEPNALASRYGFECLHYVSPLGGDVYRYRKQIFK